MSLPPLFTACTALHTIDSGAYFVLVREGKAFPIPTAMLPRFQYLMLIVESVDDTDEEAAAAAAHCVGDRRASPPTASGAIRAFDIDAGMFTDDAMAMVASYCRLGAHTAASDIPRNVERFMSAITASERTFLETALPVHAPHQSVGHAFEALSLAEFLQIEDLLVLLSGWVALRLHGRTTEGMRALLGIDPSTTESDLFSSDTLYLLRAEDEWLRVPTSLP